MKKTTSEYKLLTGLFFRLLPYQVLLIVINAVNGIVDSLYASNLIGQTAMSAIGLFGPMNHFLYAASMMFVSGSQIIYGRYLAQDRSKINGLFTTTLVASGGLSLVTSLFLVFAVLTNATRVFVSTEPDLQMLNQYILGQAIGIPALLVGQQLFAFLSLENQTKRTMIASLVCFAANVVMNHLFVAILQMGTFGLGLSTAISMWLFLGIQAWYYISGKSEWKFSLRSFSRKDAPQILLLGYAGALSRFVEMFRCLIVNFLLLKYVGSVGLSSFAASNSLLAVIWAVPFGAVAVARMLFTVSIGEEDRRSLVNSMRVSLLWGFVLICGFVLFLNVAADPLTRLFYQDPADPVFGMTVNGFRILPLCMPLSIFTLLYASYAQCTRKKVLSVIVPIVDGMLGVVLSSLVLIPLLKMNGLYFANILNGVITSLVIVAGAWAALKRFPRSLEDVMAIPEGFGAPDEDRIDISVRSGEEVIAVSQRIMDFCASKGIDRRRAYFAGLCMEEMAGNVVEHGFTSDHKQHSIDIRVARTGDDLILRIRDNCSAFNPSEHARAMEPGETGKNIGIRLVYSIAHEVAYQNLLGMNVLLIRI